MDQAAEDGNLMPRDDAQFRGMSSEKTWRRRRRRLLRLHEDKGGTQSIFFPLVRDFIASGHECDELTRRIDNSKIAGRFRLPFLPFSVSADGIGICLLF